MPHHRKIILYLSKIGFFSLNDQYFKFCFFSLQRIEMLNSFFFFYCPKFQIRFKNFFKKLFIIYCVFLRFISRPAIKYRIWFWNRADRLAFSVKFPECLEGYLCPFYSIFRNRSIDPRKTRVGCAQSVTIGYRGTHEKHPIAMLGCIHVFTLQNINLDRSYVTLQSKPDTRNEKQSP